jgi:anti-sigma B factor antagonist
MQLETEEIAPGVTQAKLTGRMDIEGARSIDLHFNVLAGSRRALIVDMAGVTFVASMGLRTLILGLKAVASKKGKAVILNPTQDVNTVLVASGVDTLAPIVRDLADAIAAVSP